MARVLGVRQVSGSAKEPDTEGLSLQEVNGLRAELFWVGPVLVGAGWSVEELMQGRVAIAGLRVDGADKRVWVDWLRGKGAVGV